jgi:large subunit ribosomal protein L3
VQIGFEDSKPRRIARCRRSAHDAKAGVAPHRYHRELRLDDDDAGRLVRGGRRCSTSRSSTDVMYVDVTATSKGKGFQGPMKRHNFKRPARGQPRRAAGAPLAGLDRRPRDQPRQGPEDQEGQADGRPDGQRTRHGAKLDVVSIDQERNLLLVKGTVPGPSKGLVMVQPAGRLNKQKARRAQAGN